MKSVPRTVDDRREARPTTSEPPYTLLHEYTDKARLIEELTQTFYKGIELFAGRECRERCEKDGLGLMHLHYPAEFTDLLIGYVNRRMKRRMINWTAEIGKKDLGFKGDFMVQDLFVVRIHYPHGHIGKPSSVAANPPLWHRLWYGWDSRIESIRQVIESKAGPIRLLKTIGFIRRKAVFPMAYRVHAAHKDSWQGQSVGALSVWLGISGLDRDNALFLYPDTADVRMPIGVSRYFGSGCVLPEPTRPKLGDGDLIVFSTDILHGGQLNVSEFTRVSITTRIDPGMPVYDPSSLWYVQRWYSGAELLRGHWRRRTIPGAKHPNTAPGPQTEPQLTPSVRIPSRLLPNQMYRVAPSSAIGEGKKFTVEFENSRILLLRSQGRLKAFSGKCPHGAYNMDDGFHDDKVMVCPGHGLEFDAQTGKSALNRYCLTPFEVEEKDGAVFVGARRLRNEDANNVRSMALR
jgi:nitrite reductase/ring-hydroxylating ferredoxin subunit